MISDSTSSIFKRICFQITETGLLTRSIYKNEGIGALWKGVGATMVGVIPSRAIYFSTYAKSKDYLSKVHPLREDSKSSPDSSIVHFGAAVIAGITTATATNPIWMVKTRLQLDENHTSISSKGSWKCIINIIQKEGVFGLYKGMTASYLGVVEGTLQWLIYEKLKIILKKDSSSIGKAQWSEIFGAAALSKLIAASIAYPHEVLRTRLREATGIGQSRRYYGIIQTTRTILQEEGYKGFYGGLAAHLLRAVPNSAIMFFCYELLLHSYQNYCTEPIPNARIE